MGMFVVAILPLDGHVRGHRLYSQSESATVSVISFLWRIINHHNSVKLLYFFLFKLLFSYGANTSVLIRDWQAAGGVRSGPGTHYVNNSDPLLPCQTHLRLHSGLLPITAENYLHSSCCFYDGFFCVATIRTISHGFSSKCYLWLYFSM